MIDLSEVGEAEARFTERQPARDDLERKVAEGRVLEVDEPGRIRKRLDRLAAAVTAGPAAAGIDGDVVVLERMIGVRDLLGTAFLTRGAAAARTVARMRICSRPGLVEGFGTGFLIGPGLLITNHHMLPDEATARHSEAELDFEVRSGGDPGSSTVFGLEPDAFFLTDLALDFTVVAVASQGGGRSLEEFGFSPLIEAEGKVILNERLNIVLHPNGEPKQVALRENRLVDLLDDFLHYVTDIAQGSPGSPVYNDQWEVVGLHRSGVPRRDDQGRVLTLGGEPWTPSMGEGEVDWIANEGVRVSRICKRLRSAPLSGPQAARRDALLGAAAAGATVVRSAGVAAAASRQGAHASLVRLVEARGGPYYDEASDDAARAGYYTEIDPSAGAEDLFRALAQLLTSTHHTEPDYRPHLELYPDVDLQPDGMLRSIYTGEIYSPEQLIVRDARTEQRLLQTANAVAGEEERSSPVFNCEHVVPQSWFDKREPMRGDLHHLFTCQTECNGFRGNIAFFDFADFRDVVRERCGKQGANRFEPHEGKGAVARATFYFLVRYPGLISRSASGLDEDRLAGMLRWHDDFPVTVHERHRNARIQSRQGNRNPFVDHPAWGAGAALALGLS